MKNPNLGILGTGHLARYTVAGLRKAGDQRSIFLSPRNAHTAKRVAEQHQCTVALSNQNVIEQSDVILLAVRPHQLDKLLTDLTFEQNQLVISAIAGVTIAELKTYPNLTKNQIVRTLPTVSAEVNTGIVPLYPNHPVAEQLLSALGSVTVLDDESLFNVATTHACMQGWIYFWLDEMVQWSIEQGLSEIQARQMITETVQGAIDLSNHTEGSLQELGTSIATDGTYTLAGLDYLRSKQSLFEWQRAMQLVFDKLN